MSKACSSGTPAFIIVESWRVKIATSLPPMDLPPLMRRFFTFVTMMPWRRMLALTAASPPARNSPRTSLPVRSLPSHSKMKSGALFAAIAVAISPPTALSGMVARFCLGEGVI